MDITPLQKLLVELKRRRVFRTAAAYGAGAFVVLEAIDLLAEGLQLPQSVLTASTVSALVGFPLALALSWFIEIRPEGRLARTQGVTDAELAELIQEAPARRWGGGLLALGGVVLLAAGIVTGSGGAWLLSLQNQDEQFAAQTLPLIEQLLVNNEYLDAFDLATQVTATSGPEHVPEELWERMSRRVSVESTPSGAVVHVQPFDPDAPWTELGQTPLTDARVPNGILRWRVEHDGFVDGEFVGSSGQPELSFALHAEDSPESSMVRVPGRNVRLYALGGVRAPTAPIGDFLLDRFEVTNAEFAEFVEAGGYEREELWVHEIRDGDALLTFDQAMERFVDATGRSGPATWEFGTFPDGQGDHPVGGVSWFEAEAYAAFAGKELPTLYHWYLADNGASLELMPGFILRVANYEGPAPRATGDAKAIGVFGAYEMAGNMREWTASASDGGYLSLGGAWTDPSYLYLIPPILPPLDRDPGNGFRTMRQLEEVEQPDVAWAALPTAWQPDPRAAVPVPDDVYRLFTGLFEREPIALEPTIEEEDDSSPLWTKQRITYAAGYGDDRMTALLYLPKSARPPYQTMIFMGGVGSFSQRPSDTEGQIQNWGGMEMMLRGGRAVLFPLWKGSYERADGYSVLGSLAPAWREKNVQWVKELRQSIDYLETRDDIDADRVGYRGASFGAGMSPVLLALEPRLKTAVLTGAGFFVVSAAIEGFPADIDPATYAPRVTQPVLMMNGHYDAIFPYESSQVPFFEALGTPASQKKHLTFPSGHSTYGWATELRDEAIGWLDELFGEPSR